MNKLSFLEQNKELEGMKGFVVMDDMQDLQEYVVLTFWETKKDMDAFLSTR